MTDVKKLLIYDIKCESKCFHFINAAYFALYFDNMKNIFYMSHNSDVDWSRATSLYE